MVSFNAVSTCLQCLRRYLGRLFCSWLGRDFCFVNTVLGHALKGRDHRVVVIWLESAGKTAVSPDSIHGGWPVRRFIHPWALWKGFLESLIVRRWYTVYISFTISQHRQPLLTTNVRASFWLTLQSGSRSCRSGTARSACALYRFYEHPCARGNINHIPPVHVKDSRRPPLTIKQNKTAVGRLIPQLGRMGFARGRHCSRWLTARSVWLAPGTPPPGRCIY